MEGSDPEGKWPLSKRNAADNHAEEIGNSNMLKGTGSRHRHRHTHIQAHTHTHTHTYIYIYIYI